ncbi:MAG TPA: hypothetical protein VGI39_10685, partial [Polyangiaceae bacterium]
MKEAIILVPGLFGFAKIGDISYFAKVKGLLSDSADIASKDIFELSPLPTGPLWRRVACVYDKVVSLRKAGFDRIHLVGHSTGGVDVRLLTSAAYLWPGGPSGAEREEFFSAIGRVISISAPHRGTPIAVRLRGTLENSIPFLFLLSILAKSKAKEKRGLGPLAWAASVVGGLAMLTPLKPMVHVTLEQLGGLEKGEALEAEAYLKEIVDCHPLIHELTPAAMLAVNSTLAGGTRLPVVNFITVSPAVDTLFGVPLPKLGRHAIQRLIYMVSYWSTSLAPNEFGDLPGGGWLLEVKPSNLDDLADIAQDGVVPAGSQTMGGELGHSVQKLVFADHLDVVGHYPGARGGETVFESGAQFDDARMRALWHEVGVLLRE